MTTNLDLEIKPVAETAVNSILGLLQQGLEHDRLTGDLIEEKLWVDPDFDSTLNLIAWLKGRPVGVISAVFRPNQSQGFVKFMVVLDQLQGQGIGSLLLQKVERRLAALGAKTIRLGESAPNYLWPGVDLRYTRAFLFFERKGYQRLGPAVNMTADLRALAPFKGQPPDDVFISRASHQDHDGLMTFLERFWPSWQDEAARAFTHKPISAHLAFHAGDVIGFSMYDANNIGTAWFGPMGTDPQWSGRGIGAILLRRCLQDLKGQGHLYATIPWVGPVEFYARQVGARISRCFYRYEKDLEHKKSSARSLNS